MPDQKNIAELIKLNEPEYQKIAAYLTAKDIPVLLEWVSGNDRALAIKSLNVLGWMKSRLTLTALKKISKHTDPVMRLSVALILRKFPDRPESLSILRSLLDDDDIGVKKFALMSVEHIGSVKLKGKVEQLNKKEQNDYLKQLSEKVLHALK